MIRRTFAGGIAAFVLVGCSQATPHPDLPRECEAFVSRYQACLAATIPSRPEIARDRAAQTRASLEESTARASESGPQAVAQLASSCEANPQSLSCAATSSESEHK